MAANEGESENFGQPAVGSKARCLRDFVQEIAPNITPENLKAMKRFLRDVISLNIGVNCDSPNELMGALSTCHCINDYDLDLLEDLLGVTGRDDILDLLRDFKKKCSSVLESITEERVGGISPGRNFKLNFKLNFKNIMRKLQIRISAYLHVPFQGCRSPEQTVIDIVISLI